MNLLCSIKSEKYTPISATERHQQLKIFIVATHFNIQPISFYIRNQNLIMPKMLKIFRKNLIEFALNLIFYRNIAESQYEN